MKTADSLYLVDGSVLPPVYIKVVEAKRLLTSGKAKTINDAVLLCGISRSAFYKYKDHIHTFDDKDFDKVYTVSATLYDVPGVLQAVLSVFAGASCNVLTINQNIPHNDIAPVSISFSADSMNISIEQLLKLLVNVEGIIDVDLIGSNSKVKWEK